MVHRFSNVVSIEVIYKCNKEFMSFKRLVSLDVSLKVTPVAFVFIARDTVEMIGKLLAFFQECCGMHPVKMVPSVFYP